MATSERAPPRRDGQATGQPAGPLGAAGYAAILGIGVLPAIASGTVSVMLPAISDAFGNGHNGLAIKSAATATGLGMMIGAPPAGLLLDRLGRRVVLIAAAALFGVLGCGIMLASQLWQVIAARFVIGLASGALGVGTAAFIGDHLAGRGQSRWLGYNAGFATFAILLLGPLTGALFDRGWRYGFAVYVLAVPVLVAIARGIPRGDGRGGAGGTGRPLTRADVPWRALLLAVFLGTLSTGTTLYWPFRLRELGVVHARDIALYGLPNVLMSGAAALGYGMFRRALSVSRIFLLGALCSAAGLVAVALAGTPVVILAGLAIEGMAIGMMTPNLTTFALLGSAPATRGRSVGLVKGAFFGSPFLTQFVLEPISVAGGTVAALWTIASLAATIALAVGAGALRLPREAAGAAA